MQTQAEQLYRDGRYEEALQGYASAIVQAPHNADLYYEFAMCQLHLQRAGDALISLDRARALDPNNPFRYASRAYVRDRVGDLDGAIEDYRAAIHLDPQDAISHNNLGLLLEKAGYLERSRDHLRLADTLAGVAQPQIQQPAPPLKSEKVTEELWTTSLSVFKSKAAFKEFVTFVFKGFKL